MIYFEIITTCIFLAIAAYIDQKTHRIPNWLTFSTLGIALLYTVVLKSTALPAIGIYLLACFLCGCAGMSGWGDIKVMMAVGVLNNWATGLATYIIAQIYLILSVLLMHPRKTAEEISNTTNQVIQGNISIDNTAKKYPLAPCILGGYITVQLAKVFF